MDILYFNINQGIGNRVQVVSGYIVFQYKSRHW